MNIRARLVGLLATLTTTTQTFPPQIPTEQQAILHAIRTGENHALTD